MPAGRFGPRSNGRGLSRLVPTEPISQLAAPGGLWMMYSRAVQFQATPQPIDQPCPEPMDPRLRNSKLPSGARQLS